MSNPFRLGKHRQEAGRVKKQVANYIEGGGDESPTGRSVREDISYKADRIEGVAAVNARRNYIRLMLATALAEGRPITTAEIVRQRLARELGTELEERTILIDLKYINAEKVLPVDSQNKAIGEAFYHVFPPSANPDGLSGWSSDVVAIETDARLAAHLVHAWPFQEKVFLTCENNAAPMVKDMLVLNPWPEMLTAVCDHDTIIIFCPNEEAALILHHKIMHTYDQTPKFRLFKANAVLPQQDYRPLYRHIEDAYRQQMEGLRDARPDIFVNAEDILTEDPYLKSKALDSKGEPED